MSQAQQQKATDPNRLFIARQPIVDGNCKVMGYELLFRDSKDNRARGFDGDRATSKVITDTFLEIGLEKLVGNKMGFFNLTRSFLINDAQFPLSSMQVGLEILESVKVDKKLIDSVKRLANQGFTIALDDYVYSAETEELLSIAHYVKLDVLDPTEAELREQIRAIRQYPPRLIAERVETPEQFELAKALGFDYFQGYFLCKPELLERERLPDNKLNILRALAKLEEPDASPKDLEKIIRTDVTLSYKLLRCVNSAYYGLSLEIESVRHAIVYLGIPAVRNWVRLLILAGLTDRPPELIKIALTRAKMCELLSQHAPNLSRETAFTVGLFSVLDALLNAPMDKLLPQLPLSEEIERALMEEKGSYGVLLHFVKAHEQGNWELVEEGPYPTEAFRESYIKAVESAENEQI